MLANPSMIEDAIEIALLNHSKVFSTLKKATDRTSFSQGSAGKSERLYPLTITRKASGLITSTLSPH